MNGISYERETSWLETCGQPLPWNLLCAVADHPPGPWGTSQPGVPAGDQAQEAACACLPPQLQRAHLQDPGQSCSDWQLLSWVL